MTIHDAFDRLLSDEPPLLLTVEPALEQGRRVQRRKRLATTVGVLGATGALVAASLPFALQGSHKAPAAVQLRPAAAQAPTTATSSDAALSPEEAGIAKTIAAASPSGWTFSFRGNDGSLEGTVDDGAGAARLMVGVSTSGQLVHPCLDPEFKAGVTCTERVLPSGAVMSLRALTTWTEPGGKVERWFEAVVTRPDGSGFNLENGNFTIPTDLPKVLTTAAEKKLVTANTVTREQPAYALDQLAAVLTALDAARG